MHCLDCFVVHLTADALAVCRDCGAGVCADHAVIRDRHLTRTVPLNRAVTVDPPARIIRCPECDAAHAAAAGAAHRVSQQQTPQHHLT